MGKKAAMESRLVAAALRCFAQYGVSKTTLEDVAQTAGVSRATLYRYFPGKQALLDGVLKAELRRFAADIDAAAGQADTLEELVVAVLIAAGAEFANHDALRHVLVVEPEVVLPHLAFEKGNRVMAVASLMLAPHLARFLPAAAAAQAGEWVGRVACTYVLTPSDYVSVIDEASVRRLVRTYVLPGVSSSVAAPAA